MTALFEDEKSPAYEAGHLARNASMPLNAMLSPVSTTPTWPIAPRTRIWPAVAIATLAAVLAAAALIVALTRPSAEAKGSVSSVPTTATYTQADVATAHQKLCDAYAMAARAGEIETKGGDPALAGVAGVNGALILQTAAAAPALAASDRSAALALAEAYRVAIAVAAYSKSDDPTWISVTKDVNARDVAMKQICNA